jgi:hypothetical protein
LGWIRTYIYIVILIALNPLLRAGVMVHTANRVPAL